MMMKISTTYFVVSAVLFPASVRLVVDAAALRRTMDKRLATRGGWQKPPYYDEYHMKLTDYSFEPCAFLQFRGIDDPIAGETPCRPRAAGDYACAVGLQQCVAEGLDTHYHPTEICKCDGAKGILVMCEDWNPCVTKATRAPTARPVESVPEVTKTVAVVDDPWATCDAHKSCDDCLAGGCAWIDSCLPNCGFVADDVKCYEGDAAHQCSAMRAAEQDEKTCRASSSDCDVCTGTKIPSTGLPCLWLDFGAGTNPTCVSSCEAGSCGITDGVCPEEPEIKPEPVPPIQPDPATETKPEPLPPIQPDPATETKPEPLPPIQPDPATETKPEPLPPIQPDPATEVQPQSVTVIRPQNPLCPARGEDLDCTNGNLEGVTCDFGVLMCARDCFSDPEPRPLETCGCEGGMHYCAQGVCPDILCWVEGRPFVDHEGTTKMAEAFEMNEGKQPARWSKSSTSSTTVTALSNDRRIELADEWKRRALGEHSSIASFAAFSIALMTNQAPPDLVQASLVAAMDELRHAETSFEMASLLLDGSVVEPSSLPASTHEFQQNLTTLASGVAQEGCVDETLSALVLAASVDQLQQDGMDDPVLQLLAEKTTQIAKEEGTHSVLAWRTIHWVCSTAEKEACDEVLNNWLEENRLEHSGYARLDSDESSIKAWRFIYKQVTPLVTEVASSGELGTLLEDDGRLVTVLANNIVSGVRTAIAANGFVAQTLTSSPTALNCSSSASGEETFGFEASSVYLARESSSHGGSI